MPEKTLLSIIESPNHPNFTALYREAPIEETKISSMRKAIAAVKKQPPDFIVAEFFYGYRNNYVGLALVIWTFFYIAYRSILAALKPSYWLIKMNFNMLKN